MIRSGNMFDLWCSLPRVPAGSRQGVSARATKNQYQPAGGLL